MVKLYERDQSVISRHIKNIFKEGELDEESNMQKMHITYSDKSIVLYNLDVIISVGYRVKSKNGIIFRRWANKVLKDYLIKGYAVNNKRLEYLEKTVKLIDIAGRIDKELKGSEAQSIIKVINTYSNALNLLDEYDHRRLSKPPGTINDKKITYEDCIDIINKIKFNSESDIFALERNEGLKAIIGNIYINYFVEKTYIKQQKKKPQISYT